MPDSPPATRAARRLIVLVFATHGLIQGGFFARIADIQRAAGLTESELGLCMVGVPAGILVASLLVSPMIERRGTRAILLPGLPFYAGTPALAALAPGIAGLFAALFLLGIGFAVNNVAMNVEADRVEAAGGGRLLNRCHGLWSLGFLGASLIGAGAVAVDLGPLTHLAIMWGLLCVAALAVVGALVPSPARAHAHTGPSRRFALPTVGILMILGFALSGMLLEGSARNWSVIFVRDVFHPADWVAALALPSFVAAQTLGRLLADRWIDRWGPVRVAIALSAISLAGLAAVAAGLSVAASLCGFALIGLGISTVYPQAFSAAARLGDRPASQNVAAMATVQTLVGFAFPPLFGLTATEFGIQASYAMILPLPVLAALLARRSLGPR